MSTTIPAAVALELRGALYLQLGGLAETLATVNREPTAEQLHEWSEPIAVLKRSCALLDRLGWVAREPEPDARVDLDRYRPVILDALRTDLDIQRSLMSEPGAAAEGQRQRASSNARTIETFAKAAGLDLDLEREARRITVPDDFTELLLDALLGELRQATQEVESGPDPESLEHFDAIRELLDAIDWGAVRKIDVDLYGYALQRVLAGRLDLERYMLASAVESVEKGHDEAEQARDRAYAYTLEVERFMEAAGFEIPEAGAPEGGDRDASE
jgi:hypothetical protein